MVDTDDSNVEEFESSKLWRGFDDKTGQQLFTQVPNAVMTQIISGGILGAVETRMILYICRMSFGFGSDETCYLGADDFKDAMGMQKSHFSKYINKLLQDRAIFRGKEGGGKYKYAVNLLSFGCTMKHYKIVDAGYKLSEKEYTFDNKSYTFCNRSICKSDEIVYKTSGFDSEKKLYIKKDIKSNKKIDNVSSGSSSSVGATKVDSTTTTTKTSQVSLDSNGRLKSLLKTFEDEVLNNLTKRIQIMSKHMHIVKDAGFTAGDISIRWHEISGKYNQDKGEKILNYRDCFKAVSDH